MKSLIAFFTGLFALFAAFFWLCGRYAATMPAPKIPAPQSPDAGQYTLDARCPAFNLLHLAYHVTSLGNYRESGTLFPPTGKHLPVFAPPPGYMGTVSSAGNKHGQIVGTLRLYESGAWLVIQNHGFLWQRGHMHNLGSLPGYQISYAVAINDKGMIVGDAVADSFPANVNVPGHAVCWVGGKIHDLGIGAASAINDSDAIIGTSPTGTPDCPRERHALLWTHGYRYDLNDCIPPRSGWLLGEAAQIDGQGRITGYGTFHGQPREFRLTPR